MTFTESDFNENLIVRIDKDGKHHTCIPVQTAARLANEKLKKMKFTPEDFLGHDMSPPTKSVSRYGLEPYQAERIAAIANQLIEEIEK